MLAINYCHEVCILFLLKLKNTAWPMWSHKTVSCSKQTRQTSEEVNYIGCLSKNCWLASYGEFFSYVIMWPFCLLLIKLVIFQKLLGSSLLATTAVSNTQREMVHQHKNTKMERETGRELSFTARLVLFTIHFKVWKHHYCFKKGKVEKKQCAEWYNAL